MKRCLALISGLVIVMSSVSAIEKEDAGLQFVKTLIEKAGSENGYINALRYFQYTATTAKNNPSSYVLSKWGKDAVDESGLKPSDKGKFISVLSNRKGARIEKLWKENKDELLGLYPASLYNEMMKYEVDSLLEFRSRPDYSVLMKKMKAKSKKPGVKTIDHAGAITGWSGYKQLSFWFRRDYEKNDKVVLEILKELKEHYSQE